MADPARGEDDVAHPIHGWRAAAICLSVPTVEGNRNYADDPEPRWYSENHDYAEYGDQGRRTDSGGYRVPEARATSAGTGGTGYGDRSVGPRSGEPLPPLPGDDPSDPLTGSLPSDEPVQRYHAEPIDLAELRRGATATMNHGGQPSPVSSTASMPYGAAGSPVGVPPGDTSGLGHTPSPAHSPSMGQLHHTADPMQTPNPLTAPSPAIPHRVVTSPNLSTPAAGPLGGAGPVAVTGPLGGAGPAGGASPEPERGGLYHTRRAGLALMLAIATFFLELPVLWAFSDSAFNDRVSVPGTISSLLMMIGLPMFALGLYASFSGAAASPTHGPRAWARTPLAYLPIALAIFLAAALAAR